MEIKNIIIVVLCVVVAGLLYLNFGVGSKVLTPEEAVNSALAYINNVMLSGVAEATLEGDITEEAGNYKFEMKIGEEQFPAYVAKNGELFFPQGIELKETENTDLNNTEVVKSDNPVLEAFVVSYCPYGLQMQRIIGEVVKGIPELNNNIKITYMGSVADGNVTSMHGEEEAEENLRQICLREEQKDAFLTYLDCFIKAGNTDGCLQTSLADQDSLTSCAEGKGADYATIDFNAQQAYQITGSPTLILNGVRVSESDFGGRTADAIKSLVCSGFNTQPEFCAIELTKDQAAASFSETYSSTVSGNTGTCN